MTLWGRYRRLPPDERHLFREALAALVREETLRRLPRSARHRIGPHAGSLDTGSARAVGLAVQRAARVTRSRCLVQALAGQRLLLQRRLAAEVVVGTRQTDSGLEAHAWLRHGGEEVLGGPTGSYAEMRPVS